MLASQTAEPNCWGIIGVLVRGGGREDSTHTSLSNAAARQASFFPKRAGASCNGTGPIFEVYAVNLVRGQDSPVLRPF